MRLNHYRSTKRSFKNGIVIANGSGGWAGGRAGGRKQKWFTGPRVTKFGTEVRPNTLLNSTGNSASSYFRSAAIRHFEKLDILNFGPYLPSGSIKMHKIWYVGQARYPTHNNRKWRHWLLPVGCTAAILIFTLRCRSRKRFRRISPNLAGLTNIPSDIFPQKMTSSATSFRQQTPFFFKIYFCRKWTTGPRITKFGTEVQHNTLVNNTGIGASNYFRSATIRHFYFLHNVIALCHDVALL